MIQDPHSNSVALVQPLEPADELRDRLQLHDRARPQQQPRAAAVAERRALSVRLHASTSASTSSTTCARTTTIPDGELTAWARQFIRTDGPTGTRDLLVAMNQHIRDALPLRRRATRKARRRPLETLRARQRLVPRLRAADDGGGAPARRRDALRLGLPVRPGARRRRRRRHASAPATRTPGCRPTCRVPAGCRSIRPTTCSAARQLIRVGVARDPSQAAPISGSWFGESGDYLGMTVAVTVQRR